MNYGRYFIPNMGMQRMIPYAAMPRNFNLLNKAFNSLKSFNWKSLLNGANKTLNVVNQTIPLIKQASPMVNNVKSMVRLAKAFGNETGNKNNYNHKINHTTDLNNDNNSSNEYPTFFV